MVAEAEKALTEAEAAQSQWDEISSQLQALGRRIEIFAGSFGQTDVGVALRHDVLAGRIFGREVLRRLERLNALQFITRLIVGKELGRAVPLILDVEGYRKRREKQLRRMARRLADQVARTGRKVVLEPMPANERRIIHITLRDDPRVTTESIGEEPRRKVVIFPVK